MGGAARFKTLVDDLSDKNPLVLFSGDALAPSKSKSKAPVVKGFDYHCSEYCDHGKANGADTEFVWGRSSCVWQSRLWLVFSCDIQFSCII